MIRFLPLSFALVLLAGAGLSQGTAWRGEWPVTDFSRTEVDLREIRSGGPPRDGIPALDDPAMLTLPADHDIPAGEPVLTVEIGEEARAYPIRYLMWHEIANDIVAGVPVTVTYCPLCNSGIVFDRRLGESVLSFGVTGKLRHSDMVMYDRQTESWWQQFLGRAIVGELAGQELTRIPAWMESMGDFQARNPGGLVMARPAFARGYGLNPYQGYDGLSRPFLYAGEMPPHGIEPLARVVVVGNRAWPLDRLRAAGRLTEAGLDLHWQPGAVSALDAGVIEEGRMVGSVRVRRDGLDIPHDVAFAFAFHAFFPDGIWMRGADRGAGGSADRSGTDQERTDRDGAVRRSRTPGR